MDAATRCAAHAHAFGIGLPKTLSSFYFEKATAKKWAALAALIGLQTMGSVVYKVSQTSSRYEFSPFSALAMAEAIKLAICVALYRRSRCSSSEHLPVSKTEVHNLKWRHILEITVLSTTYFVNNHIVFEAYLRADVASVVMFKSTSSLAIAFVRVCLCRVGLAPSQWRAIIIQICGLIVTQYNACSASTILPSRAYGLLCVSVIISAIASVWNEHQLKDFPVPLLLQNIIMYAGGTVLNTVGHRTVKLLKTDTPGFFNGYNAAAVGVVFVNACTGIVITAVYKYADAVVKSLALSIATVTVMLLSWACFGLALTPINASGCIVIVLAVYSYNIGTTPT